MDDWGERDARWAGVRTEWIDVQGTAVRTLRADGPDDGIPTLLVHGLGGAATNWLEVIAPLAERGPVLAVDLPGFGETAPPRDTAMRIRAQARFVPAVCRAVGWERVAMVGNSMGGLIATMAAAREQELAHALVLVNPSLPAPARAALKVPTTALITFAPFVLGAGERVLKWRYARRSVEEVYEDTLDLVLADPERLRPALREVGLEAARRGRELGWRLPSFVTAAESLLGMMIGPGRRRIRWAIEAVQAPTLLLWGEQDELVGRAVIDGLTDRRPDWDVHVWDDVGHAPMIEVPDRFLRVVGDWLDRQGRPEALTA